MQTTSSLFLLLREATSALHQAVEEQIGILQPEFDREDYGLLLERFYGFWLPLEGKFQQIGPLQHPDLGLAGRLKSSLLEGDLRILGRDPEKVARCRSLPCADSLAEGIGCLYVLEGSTLGGRIISRHIQTQFGLDASNGAAFFNAYGENAGLQWRTFRQFGEAHVPLAQAGEAIAAANETFSCFLDWLEGTRSGVRSANR